MEIPIIQIGNSKGLRLKKSILDRYNIKDKVEIIFQKGQIILRPIDIPRNGWDKTFKEMHQKKYDNLLMDDVFADENFEEWIWTNMLLFWWISIRQLEMRSRRPGPVLSYLQTQLILTCAPLQSHQWPPKIENTRLEWE